MAREKIKLTSYNELLGINDDAKDIELTKLKNFKNHPFKVFEDEKMDDLVKSIRENGVLSPILVREAEDGQYEIISGHRRKRASEIAGLNTVPAIVKNLDDIEATIVMVDSNIQREEILPSEKAFALKMKMEALKEKDAGSVRDYARDISDEDNMSERQVFRYIRLTYLIPELLDLVDSKELTMVLAIDISYMDNNLQREIYNNIVDGNKVKKDDIDFIKRNTDTITIDDVKDLLTQEKQDVKKAINVTLKQNRLDQYFTPDYSKKEIEEIIYSLLDKWKEEKV